MISRLSACFTCFQSLKKQGRIHGTRCAQYASENNAGRTDGRTDLRTDGRTDGRTDTPSYRDATAHLKTSARKAGKKTRERTFWMISSGKPTQIQRLKSADSCQSPNMALNTMGTR